MRPVNFIIKILAITFLVAFSLPACSPVSSLQQSDPGKISVVATTSIVGDVVHQIAGDKINLTILMPVNTDPHTYEPTPQDIARTTDARVVFINGVGLEGFIENILRNSGDSKKVVSVSDGISLRQFSAGEQAVENPGGTSGPMGDPHVWVDPNNVQIWVKNITAKLVELDSENGPFYQANADKYLQQLKDLDQWIRKETDAVPPGNRKIITDHVQMGYFADRYGYEQVGAIIPGYSTVSQPSAQDIVNLENAIKKYTIKAVFIGETVNPTLGQRITEDTGTKLVYFYTGSLSDQNGPASTYVDYMRYNVSVITSALK